VAKAQIIDNLGSGYYTVRILFDTTNIDERILDLQTRQTEIVLNISDAEDRRDAAQDDYDAQVIALDSAITTYSADPSEQNKDAIRDETAKLIELVAPLRVAINKYNSLLAELGSITSSISTLSAAPDYIEVDAWCADYSLALSSYVGLIEIPSGQRKSFFVIYPDGAVGDAVYDSDRDGMLRQPWADSASATVYNLALLPAWQKWYPRYRIGAITDIDYGNDTCALTINACASDDPAFQSLDLNHATSYTDVPINYLTCNSLAFSVGDSVVVEFFNQNIDDTDTNWDSTRVRVIGFTSNPQPCEAFGFLFVPVSDDAPYGWGDPYTSGGNPVNPPLGTVLSAGECWDSGVPLCVDSTKHAFRLFDSSSSPSVEHGTEWKSGNDWWMYEDYVLSWNSLWDANSQLLAAVYHNGSILAYTPSAIISGTVQILAAAIRKISSVYYLYVFDGRLHRAVVNPFLSNQTLSYQISSGFTSAYNGLQYKPTTYLTGAAFNKSCTELIVNYTGRFIRYNIDTWNSESVTEDNFFHDSIVGATVPADIATGTIPVVAGYVPNSDTVRKLVVDIYHSGFPTGQLSDNHDVIATVKEVTAQQELVIDTFYLHRYQSGPSTFPDRQEQAGINVSPYKCDVKSRIYFVDYERWQRGEDCWFDRPSCPETPGRPMDYRYGSYRLYKGSTLASEKTFTQYVPNASWLSGASVKFFEFTWCGKDIAEDYYYLDGFIASTNVWFIWGNGEDAISRYLAHCIGKGLPLPSTIASTGWVVTDEEILNTCSGTYFSSALNVRKNRYVGRCGDWNTAYVFSRKIFVGWDYDATFTSRTPIYEWWNGGVVDLLSEAQATGDNQRLIVPARLERFNHDYPGACFGLTWSSTNNPF